MRFVRFLGNMSRENRNGSSCFLHSQTGAEDSAGTQDYRVVAMILERGGYGIHQSGKWYADDNIDCMLMEWHIRKKARRSSSKHHMRGPAKRTEEDDMRFKEAPERLIQKMMQVCFLGIFVYS